jgi:diguanylate cyclase (GGDEF)-like protein
MEAPTGRMSLRPVWRALVDPPADPYDGMDLVNAWRTGAVVWAFTSVIAVLLLAVAPPSTQGGWGWPVALAAVALWLVCVSAIVRGSAKVTPGRLVLLMVASLGQAVLLEWLAGGYGASYGEVYVLLVAYAACWPPRGVLPFFVALPPALAAPLAYGGHDLEAVAAFSTRLVTLSALAGLIFVLMTGVRATRLRLREEREHASRLARIDALTGLGNRRAFEEQLEATVSRSARIGAPFTIAVLDLNGFKLINDRYGHDWGDVVLRQAGRAIAESLRLHDTCFRWGGDEFVAILPDTARAAAEPLRDRLEAAVAASCSGPRGEPISVACGLTEDTATTDVAELLAAADREMLARKGKQLSRAA